MSEINVRIGGDNSDYKRALTDSEKASASFNKKIADGFLSAQAASDKFGKSLDRKVEMNAIAAAIGLNIQNIAQSVARFIVGTTEQEMEALKKVESAYAQIAVAIERNIALRQNETNQLVTAEKQLKRLQTEVENLQNKGSAKSFFSGIIERGSALDKLFGLSKSADAEKQAELAQKTLELTQKAGEVEQRKEKVITDNLDQQAKNAGIRADYVEKNRRELELEANLMAGRILPAQRAELDILRMQSKQREIDQRIQDILAVYPEQRTRKEKETLVQLQTQKGVLDKQITQKQQIIEATKNQGKEEEKIGEQIESNTKAWEEFKGVINSTGRGDAQLSDRELERKIDNIKKELGVADASGLGRFSGAGGALSFNSDFLTSQQRGAAGQAQAELDFRRQVRQVVATQGEDAASRQFNVSDQRLREIQQFTPALIDVRDELRKLNATATRGIPTVLLGTEE